jgi:hypothetical protein
MISKMDFKLGDMVSNNLYPGNIYELVWYEESNDSCGVLSSNGRRSIAKIKDIKLIKPNNV